MGSLSQPTLTVRHYGAAPGGHVHDHFQVLWTLDGVLDLEVDGLGLALPAGQGLVLRPGERHDFESRHGSRCLVLDTAEPGWLHRPVRTPHVQATHHLAHYLAAALAAQLPVATELGACLLAQTWGTRYPAQRPQREVNWAALTQWVTQRLARPLTVADLAAQAHLSESQFRTRCLMAVGCTPMQWVRQLRLSRARALRTSGRSVAETARLTGYDSPSALTAALRRSLDPHMPTTD